MDLDKSPVLAAVLAAVKSAQPHEEARSGMRPTHEEPYRIGVDDIDAIAARHFARGRFEGMRTGEEQGREYGLVMGLQAARVERTSLLKAILAESDWRLCALVQGLTVPELVDPKRTKKTIVESVVMQVESLRAELALLVVAAQQGVFDADN